MPGSNIIRVEKKRKKWGLGGGGVGEENVIKTYLYK